VRLTYLATSRAIFILKDQVNAEPEEGPTEDESPTKLEICALYPDKANPTLVWGTGPTG